MTDDFYTDPARADVVRRRVAELLHEHATMRDNATVSVCLDVEHYRRMNPPTGHGERAAEPSPGSERYTVDVRIPAARGKLRERVLAGAGGPVRLHDAPVRADHPDLTLTQYRQVREQLGVDLVQALLDQRGLPNGHVEPNDALDGLTVWGADAPARQAIAAAVTCPVTYASSRHSD